MSIPKISLLLSLALPGAFVSGFSTTRPIAVTPVQYSAAAARCSLPPLRSSDDSNQDLLEEFDKRLRASVGRSPAPRRPYRQTSLDGGRVMRDVGGRIQNYASDAFSETDMKVVQKNALNSGKMGERGELWVALQVFLVLAVLSGNLPFWSGFFYLLGGPGLLIAGSALIVTALNDLGAKNLTPFAAPPPGGTLVTTGIYSEIRHPMYSGLLAAAAGFSIVTGDATRLLLTAFLCYFINFKASKEEDAMSDVFPEYDTYKMNVRGKFLPQTWFKDDSLIQVR